MLQTLLPITGPVMVCILVGFVWKKIQVPYDTDMVTRLVMCVGAPCLVVSAMTGAAVSRAVIEEMFWVTLVMIVATLLLAAVVIALSRQSLRAYLGPLVFPNAGNMGLPVCLFAFGEQGLVLAIAVFMGMIRRGARAGQYGPTNFWPVEGAAGLWYFVIFAWMLFYVVLYWI